MVNSRAYRLLGATESLALRTVEVYLDVLMRREMVDWSTPSVCEASSADLARATPKNTRRLSQSNWFMVVRPCFANMHSCMPIFTELNA